MVIYSILLNYYEIFTLLLIIKLVLTKKCIYATVQYLLVTFQGYRFLSLS